MLIDTGLLPLLLFHLLGFSGPTAGGCFGPAGGAAGGGVLLAGPGPGEGGGGGWGWPSSRYPSSSIRISLISRSVHAKTVCRYKCFATAK